jgi:hypothetical protein
MIHMKSQREQPDEWGRFPLSDDQPAFYIPICSSSKKKQHAN